MRLAACMVLLLMAPAMAGASTRLMETPLAEIAADPLHYEGQTVRTCGWATHAREDVQITTTLRRNGANTPGLQVDWLPEQPRMAMPVRLCLTGVIEGLGGASGRDIVSGKSVIVSNGSSYKWRLRQTNPSRR